MTTATATATATADLARQPRLRPLSPRLLESAEITPEEFERMAPAALR